MREGETLGIITSLKLALSLNVSQGHWVVLCMRAMSGVNDYSGGGGEHDSDAGNIRGLL